MQIEQPGPDTFLELTDTPVGYSGSANKDVNVKETEDGLEFNDDDSVYIKKDGDTMTGALTLADLSNALNSGGDYPLYLYSNAIGATKGFIFDTANDLLDTDGDRLLDIRNAGSTILAIKNKSGVKQIKVNITSGNFGTGTVTNGYSFGSNVVSSLGATAFGYSNTASASYATAMGYNNIASGNGNVAMGLQNDNQASLYTTLLGFNNQASGIGFGAVGIGYNNNISGMVAVGIGQSNVMAGGSSVGIGNGNNLGASASNSVGLGVGNEITTQESFAFGWNTKLTHAGNIIIGKGVNSTNKLQSQADNQLIFGLNSTVPTMVITAGSGAGTYGNVRFNGDNVQAQFGAGQDASIYYDGTDLILNPKVVGTGTFDLKIASSSITTETLSEYITIKINGVAKKIAIVA